MKKCVAPVVSIHQDVPRRFCLPYRSAKRVHKRIFDYIWIRADIILQLIMNLFAGNPNAVFKWRNKAIDYITTINEYRAAFEEQQLPQPRLLVEPVLVLWSGVFFRPGPPLLLARRHQDNADRLASCRRNGTCPPAARGW